MAIRVPVNPETSPTVGFETFTPEGRARDVSGLSDGLASLGQSLQRVQDRKVEQQKQLDNFDLQHKLVVEQNTREKDLQERSLAADAGALGFAERVGSDYAAQNQQIVQEATAAGYDPVAVARFRVQLDSLTSNFYGKALGIQEARGKDNAGIALDNSEEELSRYYATNPNATESVKNQLRELVYSQPAWNEDEKNAQFERRWDRLKLPGAIAYVRDNARSVLETYAPHLIPKAPAAAAPGVSTPSGPFSIDSYIAKMAPAEGTAKNPNSTAVGFGQFVKNTWAGKPGETGVYQQVFGNTGETRDQILAKRNDPAVARQVAVQLTKNNVEALTKADVPISNTSVYMAHFLGAGDAVKVAKAPLDAPITSIVASASIKANPSVFKPGMTVEDFLRWTAGKMGAETNADGLVQPTVAASPADVPLTPTATDPYPTYPVAPSRDWGQRVDGSAKGDGWLGPRTRPDGNVSTEISAGVEINGKEQEIPLMVPGLNKTEMDYLMTQDPDQEKNPDFFKNMPAGLLDKATAFAEKRIAEGKSPFKQPGEAAPSPSLGRKSGIEALDALDGQQLLNVISTAQSTLVQQANQQAAEQRALTAEQRAAHEARINTLYNGLTDGTATQVDLDKAYADGWLTDYDERHKAQGIIDSQKKEETDLDRYGTMFTSGNKFNPYDKDSTDAVEAGFNQAVKIAAAKPGNRATPLDIALAIHNQTGIFPKQGAVMLRGGLASSDPNQVGAAASIASNLIATNPNFFAGIDGGADIAKQASNYQHFIDDLGMSAPEAALRVANMNKPEARRSVAANAPERDTFKKLLATADVGTVLNTAIGNPRSGPLNVFGGTQANFATPGQQAEAAQTYQELAVDHFDQFHDTAAAQAFASRQMSRYYGMSGGRLMKFPPNKAYPAVGGTTDYVLEQAREEVVQHSGLDIPVNRVWLEPSPSGSTAQAFRAGKQVPYEVHYIRQTNGHDVYEIIPGKLFVADVARAKQELADREKGRQGAQRQHEQIRTDYGISPIGLP